MDLPKFNVGDVVAVNAMGLLGAVKGVFRRTHEGPWVYEIQYIDATLTANYTEDLLRLSEAKPPVTPKFKVGDRVSLLKGMYGWPDGANGTVRRIDLDRTPGLHKDAPYHVEFTDGSAWLPEEVLKAGEVPAPAKLKVGQFVKAAEGHDLLYPVPPGTPGIIAEVDDSDVPYDVFFPMNMSKGNDGLQWANGDDIVAVDAAPQEQPETTVYAFKVNDLVRATEASYDMPTGTNGIVTFVDTTDDDMTYLVFLPDACGKDLENDDDDRMDGFWWMSEHEIEAVTPDDDCEDYSDYDH